MAPPILLPYTVLRVSRFGMAATLHRCCVNLTETALKDFLVLLLERPYAHIEPQVMRAPDSLRPPFRRAAFRAALLLLPALGRLFAAPAAVIASQSPLLK